MTSLNARGTSKKGNTHTLDQFETTDDVCPGFLRLLGLPPLCEDQYTIFGLLLRLPGKVKTALGDSGTLAHLGLDDELVGCGRRRDFHGLAIANLKTRASENGNTTYPQDLHCVGQRHLFAIVDILGSLLRPLSLLSGELLLRQGGELLLTASEDCSTAVERPLRRLLLYMRLSNVVGSDD